MYFLPPFRYLFNSLNFPHNCLNVKSHQKINDFVLKPDSAVFIECSSRFYYHPWLCLADETISQALGIDRSKGKAIEIPRWKSLATYCVVGDNFHDGKEKGRSHEPFTDACYLDSTHLSFVWTKRIHSGETTNNRSETGNNNLHSAIFCRSFTCIISLFRSAKVTDKKMPIMSWLRKNFSRLPTSWYCDNHSDIIVVLFLSRGKVAIHSLRKRIHLNGKVFFLSTS